MAKLKKSVRAKSAAGKSSAPDLQAKAEQMSRSIVDSAQQIWMAGMGAFNRAQGEGSKLFEALVREGMSIEHSTRRMANGRVDAVRDAVEDRVGVVRERAVDTWDRLEKRALNRLGVPAREDLAELTGRVEELNAQLRRLSGGKPARATAKPAAAVRTRAPARKAKAPTRSPRKSMPKSPRPVSPRG